MKPSDTRPRFGAGDQNSSHDYIQWWLLQALKVPGYGDMLGRLVGAQTSKNLHEDGSFKELIRHKYVDAAIEVAVAKNLYDRFEIVGFIDVVLNFSQGVKVGVEIKTNNDAVGATIRQIQFYKSLKDISRWIVIAPGMSRMAADLLAQKRIAAISLPHKMSDGELPAFDWSVGGARCGPVAGELIVSSVE